MSKLVQFAPDGQIIVPLSIASQIKHMTDGFCSTEIKM